MGITSALHGKVTDSVETTTVAGPVAICLIRVKGALGYALAWPAAQDSIASGQIVHQCELPKTQW